MPHIDWSINLGNIITSIAALILAAMAWKDLTWRVKNLEGWRKEHMIDADARDKIIKNIDKILYHITRGKEGRA